MTKKTDVLIVGAGAAGLSLALILGRAGMRVTVIEALDLTRGWPRAPGRSVALLRPSVAVLARAGIDAQSCPQTGMLRALELIDLPARGAPLTTRFEAHEINADYFGLNIVNDTLLDALVSAAQACKNITIYSGIAVQTVTPTPGWVEVVDQTGTLYRAALVIGADGKKSRLREALSISTRQIDYAQTAITCLITHARPHADTSTEFHRPGGPFTLVPLADPHQSSVVWLDDAARATDRMALPADAFRAALQAESHDARGEITKISPPASWPLTWQLADTLIAPRAVLVAEAAHALPPSGAQGLNLSLRDVAALADILIPAYKNGLDLGSARLLQQYAAARKRDMIPRAHAVHGLNELILSHAPLTRRVRRTGLYLAAHILPLRRALMRYAWAGG